MELKRVASISDFDFIVNVFPTAEGKGCQAIITNDKLFWSKEVGFETESLEEAEDELRYYMKHGFNFDGVQYNPHETEMVAR